MKLLRKRWSAAVAGAVVAASLSVGGVARSQAVGTAAGDAPRLMLQSGLRSAAQAVALSPDGRLMATSSGAGSVGIYVWQVETGRLLCTLSTPGTGARGPSSMYGLPGMAFSANGLQLATADKGNRVAVWDLRRCGAPRHVRLGAGAEDAPPALSTLADGSLLALGSDGVVYRGHAFQESGSLSPLPRRGERYVGLYAHTPDGQSMVLGTEHSGSTPFALSLRNLHIVDAKTGTAAPLSGFAGAGDALETIDRAAQSVNLSPNGRYVLWFRRGEVLMLDRQTSQAVGRYAMGPAGAVPPAASGGRRPAPAAGAAPQRPGVAMPDLQAMLAALPPGMREAASAQLKQAMEQAQPAIDQAMAQANAAMAAGSGPVTPLVLSFSPDGSHALVLKTDRPPKDAPTGQPAKATIEVLKVPSLEPVRSVPLGLEARWALATVAAGSAADALDRRSAGLSLMFPDGSGGLLGTVDLSGAPDRVESKFWRPAGAGRVYSHWSSDQQIVAFQGGTFLGGPSSLNAAAVPGSPAAADMRGPGPSPAGSARVTMQLVRWSLGNADMALLPVETAVPLPATISANGRYAASIVASGNLADPSTHRATIDVVAVQSLERQHRIDLPGLLSMQPISVGGLAVSDDGRRVAIVLSEGDGRRSAASPGALAPEQLRVYDASSGRQLGATRLPFVIGAAFGPGATLRFAGGGRQVVINAPRHQAFVATIDDGGRVSGQHVRTQAELLGVVGDKDLRLVVRAGGPARETQTGGLATVALKVEATASGAERAAPVTVSPAGDALARGGGSGAIELFRMDPASGTAAAAATLIGHRAAVSSLSFSPDGKRLASSDAEGATLIWDLANRSVVLRLYSFSDGSWAVVDRDGRFDTNNLENLEFLHWVVPDDPLRALPLEVFMREYFQPQLLARTLRGDKLPAVRAVTSLNRAQPAVRIARVQPVAGDVRRVDVTVEVEGRLDVQGRPGGVTDLRLFRDGKLVALAGGSGEPIVLDPRTRSASLVFRNLRLPSAGASVTFSAYAFNNDRVKGATAHRVHSLGAPQTAAAPRGRAYVVAIGVNSHDNASFDLRYAVNDARLATELLPARLRDTARFRDVVAVPLISDGDRSKDATKAKVRAVIRTLAGKADAAAELQGVPGASRLAAATPDDLVLIAFAGHGHAGDGGAFWLLPQDIGPGSGKQMTPAMLARSISTDELESWLRDVDAGEIAMVIDACHSAASVEADGFKPGPMGSKGLGQLAYDKGIRILAASQADDVAVESDRLQHGLLSFALLRDGIEARLADHRPADRRIDLPEWLAYGVTGVPKLQRDIATGARSGAAGSRGAKLVGPLAAAGQQNGQRFQQPRLFDYTRAVPGSLPLIADLTR